MGATYPTWSTAKRRNLAKSEYEEIDRYCRETGIIWFASCWDEPSVDFIQRFNVPCFKIASATLTDDKLLAHTHAAEKANPATPTGMSSLDEIDHAVEITRHERSGPSPRRKRLTPPTITS